MLEDGFISKPVTDSAVMVFDRDAAGASIETLNAFTLKGLTGQMPWKRRCSYYSAAFPNCKI